MDAVSQAGLRYVGGIGMKKARKLNYIHFVITYNFVLLIPMIIVFCSVFIMEGRQQVQKIETMLRS